tara:strand:+ start:22310 stop:22534 length:225 start_codon:yes stop_codon:yes gene_type:complete
MADINGNCEKSCPNYDSGLPGCLYASTLQFKEDAKPIDIGQPCPYSNLPHDQLIEAGTLSSEKLSCLIQANFSN